VRSTHLNFAIFRRSSPFVTQPPTFSLCPLLSRDGYLLVFSFTLVLFFFTSDHLFHGGFFPSSLSSASSGHHLLRLFLVSGRLFFLHTAPLCPVFTGTFSFVFFFLRDERSVLVLLFPFFLRGFGPLGFRRS